MQYLPPQERDTRTPAMHPRRPGYCRRCGGVILVPEGKVKIAALRNWKRLRLDPENPPRGWVVYKRATWHPWCDPWVTLLNKPGPYETQRLLGTVCACCGTDTARLRDSLSGRSSAPGWPWLDHRRYHDPRRYQSPNTRHRWLTESPLSAALEGAGWRTRDELLELDHRVPLWAGGRHQPSNLQLLCQLCHKAKTKWEAGERAWARKVLKAKALGFEMPVRRPLP